MMHFLTNGKVSYYFAFVDINDQAKCIYIDIPVNCVYYILKIDF